MQPLGDINGAPAENAFGVSADGSTIVGIGRQPHPGGQGPFRWTSAGGMQYLGLLPFANVGTAESVSGDGSVVVGWVDPGGRDEAWRWTGAGGMQPLGWLPHNSNNSFGSVADDISNDASTIVGHSTSFSGEEAFRWTSADGMQGLGDLPGGSFFSVATGVSGDGAVIVGRGAGASGNDAFVWDAVHGMQSVKQLLASSGINMTGWTFTFASDVSADGTTLVGQGIDPGGQQQGWVAVLPPELPEPASIVTFVAVGLAAMRGRRRVSQASQAARSSTTSS